MFSTVPSAPDVTVIGGNGAVVVWDTPEMPNGVIVGYDLEFTRQGTSTTVQRGVEDLYYVPMLVDVPQANGDTVTVKVRSWTCFKPIMLVHCISIHCLSTVCGSTFCILMLSQTRVMILSLKQGRMN